MHSENQMVQTRSGFSCHMPSQIVSGAQLTERGIVEFWLRLLASLKCAATAEALLVCGLITEQAALHIYEYSFR
jgi:hypothetical protein